MVVQVTRSAGVVIFVDAAGLFDQVRREKSRIEADHRAGGVFDIVDCTCCTLIQSGLVACKGLPGPLQGVKCLKSVPA